MAVTLVWLAKATATSTNPGIGGAALLAFGGVAFGALLSAGAALLTARLTSGAAARREAAARLFDARRACYSAALRTISIMRHQIFNGSPPGESLISISEITEFMAQLEILGTKAVHHSYGVLSGLVVSNLEYVETIRSQGSQDYLRQVFESESMREQSDKIVAAETKLRDAMRQDLGVAPLGDIRRLGDSNSGDGGEQNE
jgi:hypothetical protein